MFKKLLAAVGIGGAKIDTVLKTEHLEPGQFFEADIIIKGGDAEQDLSGLELMLMTVVKVSRENEDGEEETYFENRVLQHWHVPVSIIKEDEELRIPFQGQLHPETPVTQLHVQNNQCAVWLETGLNIDLAVDASDKDTLYIYPNRAAQQCLHVMERAGYQLVKADVEAGYLSAPTFSSQSGFYQELEFQPMSSSFFGVKEVELSFITEPDRTHVFMEIDRAFRGDGYTCFTIEHTPEGLERVRDQIESRLN